MKAQVKVVETKGIGCFLALNDVGKIYEYQVEEDGYGYGLDLHVKTELGNFIVGCKPTYVRLKVRCGYYRDDRAIEGAANMARQKWKKQLGVDIGAPEIADYRVVRAYILANYLGRQLEDAKDWAKKIQDALNADVDMSMKDAEEWLRRNRFNVSGTKDRSTYVEEYDERINSYIYDCSHLIEP